MAIRFSTLMRTTVSVLVCNVGHATELPTPAQPIKPPAAFHEVVPSARPDPVPVEVPEGSELITERYPNRTVKIQRTVKQDDERNYVNHGPWTMWDEQGRLVAQGEYRDGKRHGDWMRVLPQFPGSPSGFQAPFTSQATFDDGQLNGTWSVVDSQNRIVGSWDFERGELHGSASVFYTNGQQRQEMRFAHGSPDGEATAWKTDGTVWSRDYYREGKQLVPVVTWHDDKQKESEGWLERSTFRMAANVDWWEGVLEVSRLDAEGEDLRVGTWSEWHANGTPRYVGKFDEGQPVGEHAWWHENGQRLLIGAYEEGDREGRWTRWHANGQKQEEGQYVAGLKDGIWTAWSETGEVLQTEELAAEVLEVDEEFISLEGNRD